MSDPSSRRAALPVRRPDRDLHRRPPGPAHRPSTTRTASPSRRCKFPSRRAGGLAGGRLVRPARGGLQGRHHIKWRVEGTDGRGAGHDRLARLPGGSPRRCATPRRETTGGEWVEPSWDTMWFPHAFIGVMEQLQHAVKTGAPPALIGRRQRQDHGAGRGRLPLDARGPRRSSSPRFGILRQITGRNHTMMQVGIFTGYFPYGAGGDGQEDPGSRLQHGAARPALQGHRLLDAGVDHARRRPSRCARPSATTTCRSAASRATPTSSTPTRREREKRVGYLKAIIRNARNFGSPYVISETGTFNTEFGLGPPPEEQDRGGLRGVPQGHPRAGADRLRPRRRVPARDLRQQRRRLGRGDGADVRRGRPSGPRPADGPDQLFRGPQHRQDGRGPEADLRHARRTRSGSRTPRTSSAPGPTSPRSTPTSATRTRSRATPSAASARSSCRRPGLGSLNYDLYLQRLAEKHPNIPIIIEHLEEADVPRAKKFLDGKLRANGV